MRPPHLLLKRHLDGLTQRLERLSDDQAATAGEDRAEKVEVASCAERLAGVVVPQTFGLIVLFAGDVEVEVEIVADVRNRLDPAPLRPRMAIWEST